VVCLGQKAKIRLLEKRHKVFPKLLCTLIKSFPHPDPRNAPAIKSLLRGWGAGGQGHGSRARSLGCPAGLALMHGFTGGCRGARRSRETLSLQRRGQESPSKAALRRELHLASKIVIVHVLPFWGMDPGGTSPAPCPGQPLPSSATVQSSSEAFGHEK